MSLIKSVVFSLFLLNGGMIFASELVYQVEVTTGKVLLTHDNGAHWEHAAPDSQLHVSDMIKTGKDSSCEISMGKAGVFKMQENSQIKIKQLEKNAQSVKMKRGRILFNIFGKKPKRYLKVETEVAIAAVKGTQFVLESDGEKLTTSVVEGSVLVKRQVKLPSGAANMDSMLEVELKDKQEVSMTMSENKELQNLIDKTRNNMSQLKKILRSNRNKTQKAIRMMKNAQHLIDDMRSLDPDQSESAKDLDNLIDQYKHKQGYK